MDSLPDDILLLIAHALAGSSPTLYDFAAFSMVNRRLFRLLYRNKDGNCITLWTRIAARFPQFVKQNSEEGGTMSNLFNQFHHISSGKFCTLLFI